MNLKTQYLNRGHLVSVRPWPICIAISITRMMVGKIVGWHFQYFNLLLLSILILLISSYYWWNDVYFESLSGKHNRVILKGFRVGMLLFILSEVFFFFRFFWSYFHNCVSPRAEIGFLWPPFDFKGIIIDPFSIPLLKTVILLSSGARVTLAHHSIFCQNYYISVLSLFITITLGCYFLYLQINEYGESFLSIKRTIYGSVFFLLTGFHGLHVVVGTIFLIVRFLHKLLNHFSKKSHARFELCAWYWHFVDVVWLFLYFFLYWYGFSL